MPESDWLVVGLGNPGPEYENTRHNVGYLVVDLLAERMGVKLKRHRRANADAAEGRIAEHNVTLLKSRSYMNESGGPVKAAAQYGKIATTSIIVVQDELEFPFGTIRLKFGGGDGGHNGIKSLRKSFASGDFYRVRVGIGRPPGQMDPSSYVLKDFSATQRKELPLIVETAADAVEAIIVDTLPIAQNRFHS